jgi:hypothetical protein
MGRDVGPQAWRRVFEAVLLSRPPRDAWPPPRQEGTQLFGLRVRQRARRGPDRLGTVGHSTGITGIRVG